MNATSTERDIYLGIDVGTGGVRVMAVDEGGCVLSARSVDFGTEVAGPSAREHEQPPEAWMRAVEKACLLVMAELARRTVQRDRIRAVAVDATSGTLVATDASGKAVRPALMYNDPRGGAQAEAVNRAAAGFCDKLGYRFKSSFAAAKIAWLKEHEPDTWRRTRHLLHQADYVVWRLTGAPPMTDYSNALKTGYDLIDERWPAWLGDVLGCVDRLPGVVAPGTPIGRVGEVGSVATGLPAGTMVVAGATDGTAACLASGVCRPGDYNTTLGTTLVFKGVAPAICRHRQGLVYCHRLPGGLWLPGAASNTGGQWIGAWFGGKDPATMDASAAEWLPSHTLAYPLVGRGERFPMLAPEAEAFFVPEPADEVARYAACLQGVALVERLAYEELDRVTGAAQPPKHANGPNKEAEPGAETRGEVFATGGGSRSDLWMQCRADATGRLLRRPACGESAFGAAVLAACGASGDRLADVVTRMVRCERSFEPRPERRAAYDELYQAFCEQLRQRGYL